MRGDIIYNMLCGNKGLANLGNTCYINDKETLLFDQWLLLNNAMWSNDSNNISPKQFLISYIL